MPGVTYALADFVTGGPILDLPVREGADWAAQLNRPDTLACTIDMRDEETAKLDLRSATEPRKTVLFARTDDDAILAWGLIDDERVWNEDEQSLSISAKGIESSWLGKKAIGPATAKTDPLFVDGVPNPALDTTISGFSYGTIGKKLIAQLLTWPGSPAAGSVFILPADEIGTRLRTYTFPTFKRYGAALSDLSSVDNGPDFAFGAQRASNGLTLNYVMRHGSEATPRIGAAAGVWSLAGASSPISKLKVSDSAKDTATAAWATGGRSSDKILIGRVLMDDMIAAGYPPLDYIDTSHGDVKEQATIDAYALGASKYARGTVRSLSFVVRGDATPALGAYRPGDTMILSVPKKHMWLTTDIKIRITSIGGDETGNEVTIGCDVIA